MNDQDAKQQKLAGLRDEHRKLDGKISAMTSGGNFDQIELQRLKKRKLHIKDDIAHLESDILPDIIA